MSEPSFIAAGKRLVEEEKAEKAKPKPLNLVQSDGSTSELAEILSRHEAVLNKAIDESEKLQSAMPLMKALAGITADIDAMKVAIEKILKQTSKLDQNADLKTEVLKKLNKELDR